MLESQVSLFRKEAAKPARPLAKGHPFLRDGQEGMASAGNDRGSPYKQSNCMELRHRGSNFLLEDSLP